MLVPNIDEYPDIKWKKKTCHRQGSVHWSPALVTSACVSRVFGATENIPWRTSCAKIIYPPGQTIFAIIFAHSKFEIQISNRRSDGLR